MLATGLANKDEWSLAAMSHTKIRPQKRESDQCPEKLRKNSDLSHAFLRWCRSLLYNVVFFLLRTTNGFNLVSSALAVRATVKWSFSCFK